MSETSTYSEVPADEAGDSEQTTPDETTEASDSAADSTEETPDAAATAESDDDSEDDDSEDDDSEDDDSEDDESSSAREGRRRRPSLKRLEEEGEVAADYLEEFLDIADFDGDIDIDVENDRASVAIIGEGEAGHDLRRLVGSNGEVLEALQELTRLAVQARTGERSRLMLDIAGHRAGRRRKIEDIASRACQQVQRTGEPTELEPMSAFERKVAHDVVADAGLVSESEGEEPNRYVVVHPAKS